MADNYGCSKGASGEFGKLGHRRLKPRQPRWRTPGRQAHQARLRGLGLPKKAGGQKARMRPVLLGFVQPVRATMAVPIGLPAAASSGPLACTLSLICIHRRPAPPDRESGTGGTAAAYGMVCRRLAGWLSRRAGRPAWLRRAGRLYFALDKLSDFRQRS
jgi:hypothetical protein